MFRIFLEQKNYRILKVIWTDCSVSIGHYFYVSINTRSALKGVEYLRDTLVDFKKQFKSTRNLNWRHWFGATQCFYKMGFYSARVSALSHKFAGRALPPRTPTKIFRNFTEICPKMWKLADFWSYPAQYPTVPPLFGRTPENNPRWNFLENTPENNPRWPDLARHYWIQQYCQIR